MMGLNGFRNIFAAAVIPIFIVFLTMVNAEAQTKLFTVKKPGSNTSLMDVWTNGRVGIGTSSPRGELDVSSLPNGSPVISVTNNGLDVISLTNEAGNRGRIILWDQSAGGTQPINLSGYPDSNSWINNGGNFGVGTTELRSEWHPTQPCTSPGIR